MASVVGIRELRQHLSRYVEQVKNGAEFIVTERGREVARLIPSGVADDPTLALARDRGATMPEGDLLEYLDRRPPPVADFDPAALQAALDEQRAERF